MCVIPSVKYKCPELILQMCFIILELGVFVLLETQMCLHCLSVQFIFCLYYTLYNWASFPSVQYAI